MAPSTVRTVPPWVIQRPPQSLLPLHNSTPSDPRHGRRSAPNSRDSPDSRSKNATPDQDPVTNGDGSGGDEGLLTGDGATGSQSEAARSSSQGTTSATRKTTSSPTAPPPPESLPPPPTPSAPGPSSWSLNFSTLFRHKEGRKWDYLRSAEPVIVPQFHVVNGPSQGEESYYARREGGGGGGDGSGSGSRRPGNDSHLEEGGRPEQPYRQSWWYNPGTQWHTFIESSRYPHLPNEKSEILHDGDGDGDGGEMSSDFGRHAFLNPRPGLGNFNSHHHQHPINGLLRRGGGGVGDGSGSGSDSRDGSDRLHPANKKTKFLFLYQRVWRTLLHHPLGPLACRLTVLSTSIVALAVAVTIFRNEHLGMLGHGGRGDDYLNQLSRVVAVDLLQERTQIIVAIVVDVVAVPYIGYITVDDYTGKPLGLRPPQDRIRLILLDLFFIILKSASTALGFEAMIYFSSDGRDNNSDGLLRALAAFELMGLVSWALTLTINIFREIERLGGR